MTPPPPQRQTRIEPAALDGIPAFQSLDAAQKQLIALKLTRREFESGGQIIDTSDKTKDVFFLISGKVRANTFSKDGKEIQFEDLDAGQMFGELAAIDGGNRTGDCRALSDSIVAIMPQHHFIEALTQYPGFNYYLLQRLAGMLRNQLGRVIEFSAHTVKDRLRNELIRLAVRQGKAAGNGAIEILSPPTHADLASRIGTHREAVTKELSRLQKLGLITWTRKVHKVNDLPALRLLVK